MALLNEIQKAGSIVGDIGGVVSKGLDIFSQVKGTLYPTYSQSPPAPEPVAAKPVVTFASSLTSTFSNNPALIIGLLVFGYLCLGRK